jgi:putative DNA-invertase from lambdoid prophage Rac
MLGKSASVGEIANIVGLSRQTIYRIKDDPAASEAALATWGM